MNSNSNTSYDPYDENIIQSSGNIIQATIISPPNSHITLTVTNSANGNTINTSKNNGIDLTKSDLPPSYLSSYQTLSDTEESASLLPPKQTSSKQNPTKRYSATQPLSQRDSILVDPSKSNDHFRAFDH